MQLDYVTNATPLQKTKFSEILSMIKSHKGTKTLVCLYFSCTHIFIAWLIYRLCYRCWIRVKRKQKY